MHDGHLRQSVHAVVVDGFEFDLITARPCGRPPPTSRPRPYTARRGLDRFPSIWQHVDFHRVSLYDGFTPVIGDAVVNVKPRDEPLQQGRTGGSETERAPTAGVLFEPSDHFYPATAPGTPLGTAGFGFSIIMLSLFSVGALDSAASAFFPVVAISTGALAMLVGGLWDFRANNLFGATFGVAYACFLLTTGLLLRYLSAEISGVGGSTTFGHVFGAYLLVWAVFTAIFAFGAYFVNLPALIAFVLLTVVYTLAGIGNIVGGEGGDILMKCSGWVGLADGAAAWYLCFGIVLNELVRREMIPMFAHTPAIVQTTSTD